ncbi:desmoplakin-B isoform X2 [Echeneis naucrates]|uniref:Desmoplakin-like n=1 Tax=Echeneis naucrates TaxID=173247 RepID=A0A665WVJ8_ECHNA|nr:desmoplakin-like isoform X2 [Echeneis naucrates]
MSFYGSQHGLNVERRAGSKGDLTGLGSFNYARSDGFHGGGNGYDQHMDGYRTFTYTKSIKGGGIGGGMTSCMPAVITSGGGGGMTKGGMSGSSGISSIHQKAMILHAQCQEYLKKADYALQTGSSHAEAEQYMMMAKDTIEQLKSCAIDLKQMGQPNDNVVKTLEICKEQANGVQMAISGSMQRRRSTRGSSGGWEEPGRSYHDALGWISQQKRLIETAPWGEDPAAIEQQLHNHQRFHSSIQRSLEVDRARDDLFKKGDKGNLHGLEQEWDSLQQLSFTRKEQLQELQAIILEISKEIMWVNDREEEELVFDWGDKNIDQYIPKKQESYSKLMSALEDKEVDLNKLKAKVDTLLKNGHPASDKIKAYQDTLQTQWSWLLQITKCIDVHLKENAAYNQFFKESNETYNNLTKQHESVRKKFTCDKETSLENLLDLLRGLEREKEKILENKRQVQHLVNKSKSIVRLKPRNPEEKSSNTVIVKALCDFKQDQKVIHKDNEAILKDNSQRSKWEVTGPGGLDMLVPSVCLIIPPPNPLSISIANKNELYYESILSIWNQLYINVKSLIAWQYCLLDIKQIRSLTISMLAKMHPEEYRQIMKNLETHYEEFKLNSQGSQMFADDDKRSIENQYNGAQAYYEQMVVQLPTYIAHQSQIEIQQQQPHVIIIQQQEQQTVAESKAKAEAEVEAKRYEEERQQAEQRKLMEKKVEAKKGHVSRKEVKKMEGGKKKTTMSSSQSLSELHSLRLRLEAAERLLNQYIHICLGDDGVHECGLRINQIEAVQHDIDSMQQEYLHLSQSVLKELDGMNDVDKAQFLRSEVEIFNQRLGSLESSSSAYLERLRALKDMLESVARAEDLVKVHEARLTEKETTSLSLSEVKDYMLTLENIKAELQQKQEVMASVDAELLKASHWSCQMGGDFHQCDIMLSKYTEQVGLLSDRWRRIQGQIDTRLQDLQLYLPQLEHYKQTSSSLNEWIDATRQKQEALQTTKIDNIQALKDNINNQKALNAEIKARRDTLDSVLKDNEACMHSIKDYETDLASYTSGLETLLNIPIKRTMLRSPAMDLNQEAVQLQTRYMELFTMSGDYYKYLGELLKNMEELKICNTRIDLLEEQLRQLREDIQDRNAKNKSLEDAVARYQVELSQSQGQLQCIEEVKRNAAMQCSASKDSLDTTQSQLSDLNEQVSRLTYLLDEEKRKRRLAEERYTHQQNEYESVLRKRQNELETVSWSKMELEKNVATKQHEIELLQQQLKEESSRAKELQKEISKITARMQSIQSQYNEVVTERDELLRKIQLSGKDKDRVQTLEDELSRIKLSLDSEIRNKQRLQEENDRVKRDLDYWKGQYESQQSLIRQCDTDKERLEREKNKLRTELERLMRELKELEETYKSKLSALKTELQELNIVKQTMENDLKATKETPTLDTSSVIFDGVRKPVTANQLLDCGVLDKPTFSQLAKGHKTVPEVAADKKVSLKGTGPIAGVVLEGPVSAGSSSGLLSKLSLTEAKKENLLPPDCVDLLLDAQAATGHIIDPRTNQKLTVDEAYKERVIDGEDLQRLLAAEAAAVGYRHPGTSKPLSAFHAMKKGVLDKNTTLRLLQAQESVGGILDPELSVFLPKDTAVERDLIDDDIYRTLNRKPKLYLDPESEDGATYMAMKRRCKVELHTGLLFLPVSEKTDASKLVFDGVRKPVTAKQLLDCGIIDAQTFKNLEKGKKTVQEVTIDKNVNLKGSGPIAGVITGSQGKMSLSEAKKQMLLSDNCADLLMEAQAATGHIVDPKYNQKLTVEEACAEGIVDIRDRDRLLAAEAAAVGYKDRTTAKPLSVFEAMKKGLIDKKTALGLLQAQESVGGILDPNLSVFLPKDIAIKRNLLDENIHHALSQSPACYLDPDTDKNVSYGALKRRCKTEPHTGLLLLPLTERQDPSKILFDGVRKPVSAQQLFDCGVLDKTTFNQLKKGEKTVAEVSVDKKVFLKGTGSIAGVASGPSKMSFAEAKTQKIISSSSADMLLAAQAATGYIIDPRTNQKLTVKEACARGVVDKDDESMLLTAEAAVVGYRDPSTATLLSAGQAMRRGLIDKDTALRILQAQESVGGILDPNLSIFLPRDTALDQKLIDNELYRALNQSPGCYLDPDTQKTTSYVSLKRKCKVDPSTGLLLLPEPKKQLTVQGIRDQVSVTDLVDASLLQQSDIDQLNKGSLTKQDIEDRLRPYLRGSTCIAGVYDEANDKVLSIYEAMKDGLLRPGTTLELLEAQAASGFIVDPVNNQYLTVTDAYNKRLFGPELKDKLLSAEQAVNGYKLPGTNKKISLFQAIEKGLVERGHGIRLLEAQIASGGIIDPEHSHRIDINVAYERGYLDEKMNRILSSESAETKGFFDPNTEENLTYKGLKKSCITDKKSGLLLLSINDKSKSESTLRKRRVVIVDPETNKEMTVREAYDKGYIDYKTFIELSEQECEWEEITITAPDGSVQFFINDKKTGRQYDITELLEKGVIDQSVLEQYRSRAITLTEFADIITSKTKHGSFSSSKLSSRPPAGSVPLSITSSSSSSTSFISRPLSPTLAKMTTTRTTITERSGTNSRDARNSSDALKHISSVSIAVASPVDSLGEQEPVGAIFDTELLEKISITEALERGLVDSITAQRLLEAQACTGGIIDPSNGRRLGIQEAARQGIINDDMISKLKPAQKAYFGFEDVKTRKKISVAQAMKEMWLPYEAGQRFMEFQYVTKGLYDPELGCRRSIEDALKMGWLDGRSAQKLQDVRHHAKILTCPKSKLKISYKDALDSCLVEKGTGVKMLPASTVSSRGISSPYNASSTSGSATNSRSGSRRGSRRGSMDLGSPSSLTTSYGQTSFIEFSSK